MSGNAEAGRRVAGPSGADAARYLGGLLREHRLVLSAVIALGALSAVAEGLTIGLVLPFVESIGGAEVGSGTPLGFLVPVFGGRSTEEKVRLIAVLLVALQVVRALLLYSSRALSRLLQRRLSTDLRRRTLDRTLGLPMAYVDRQPKGRLLTVLMSYGEQTAVTAGLLVAAIPEALVVALYAALLFVASWQLAAAAVALSVLGTLAVAGLNRKARTLGAEMNHAWERINQATLEVLSGIRPIQLFGREEHERRRYGSFIDAYEGTLYRKGMVREAVVPTYTIVNVATIGALIIVGSFALSRSGEAWAAVLMAFLVVLLRLMAPVTALNQTRTVVVGSLPMVEALMAFEREAAAEPIADGTAAVPDGPAPIRFEGVSFRYGEDEPLVLADLSFDIRPGTKTAIIGASGAGKSTVVGLIVRFYDPSGGGILVGGTDLRRLRLADWRRRVAVVSQDTFLFNESAMYNIRYGRPEASDAEVFEAARRAHAHAFLVGLPQGYDTVLGDRGVRLSGGQRQRIAIARAILADPDVLVLDEATSALDSESERAVQRAVDEASADRTV
ncbi:MAG: ABC transporter ATP-binding protein, partial [Methanobacteriota archaeon]